MPRTYYERQRLAIPLEYSIRFLIAWLILLPGVAFLYARRWTPDMWWSLATLLLVIWARYAFGFLEIKANPRTLEFGFRYFRRSIPLDAIEECSVTQITFSRYLGIGIRFGRDGSIAYNTRLGPAVRLELSGGKKPLVISSDRPQELCAYITENRGGGPAE